jgi:hypothetical protein
MGFDSCFAGRILWAAAVGLAVLAPYPLFGERQITFEPCLAAEGRQREFVSRSADYTLSVSPGQALLQSGRGKATSAVLRMKLLNANPSAGAAPSEQLPGWANYFIGNDRSQWRTNVPIYAKGSYRRVYPGVDVVYYGNQGSLEYDFVASPQADPNVIRLAFEGASRIEIDSEGGLRLETVAGPLQMRKPVVYQQVGSTRRQVAGGYQVRDRLEVMFRVGDYDRFKPLIIDPTLVYSTFFGGSGDENRTGIARDSRAGDIAVDRDGNADVTGNTASSDLHGVNALPGSNAGGADAFVLKLDPNGSLLYATYLGGSGTDRGFGIAIDSAGNAYVTGRTQSPNFPTVNPLQCSLGGIEDAFVVKLNASGSALLYATYLGGSGQDDGLSIAVDSAGNAYVAGETESRDRPVVNAFQRTFGGGAFDTYLAMLNPQGSALVYSTYLGGTGNDSLGRVTVDPSGNADVVGYTDSTNFPTVKPYQASLRGNPCAYIVKFDPAGSVVYSTYLGCDDAALGVAADSSGNAYVVGAAGGAEFPITAGAIQTPANSTDAFVTKLDPAGVALVYSARFGGSGQDVAFGVAVDAWGNAYVTGPTLSSDLLVTTDYLRSYNDGVSDGFVMKLDAAGSRILYSTYIGGAEEDTPFGIALGANSFCITGLTTSLNFPATNAVQPIYGGGRGDVFVLKIADGPAAPLLVRIFSAASFIGEVS